MTADLFERSNLDEERFGIRVVKTLIKDQTHLGQLLEFAQSNMIDLLITRCEAGHLPLVHEMEEQGFRLMDTLINYQYIFSENAEIETTSNNSIRILNPDDVENVVKVAGAAFENYFGHYHSDPRLPREKSDQVYTSWARRSCTIPGIADQVLVVENLGEMAGFAVLKKEDQDTGDVVLFAVHPNFHRKGISRKLLIAAINWCYANGCKRVVYSTQITNYAIQRVLVRLGFEPHEIKYTFHKWL
jgi:GNAT superfamily N-acetyltransferase